MSKNHFPSKRKNERKKRKQGILNVKMEFYSVLHIFTKRDRVELNYFQ